MRIFRICTKWELSHLSIVGIILIYPAVLFAYDAGPHSDITRDALVKYGFQPDAIRIAQIQNLNTDMVYNMKNREYGLIFDIPFSILTACTLWLADQTVFDGYKEIFGSSEIEELNQQQLHWDNLSSYSEIVRVWDNLIHNTYKVVKSLYVSPSAAEDQAYLFLAVLGLTTHQVQDFYAHSNWADIEWPTIYNGGESTWFDVDETYRREKDLYTSGRVDHDILNKDYAGRPNFERSYREAYYATVQWIALLRYWVDERIWNAAKVMTEKGIETEWNDLRYIALCTGHWKGPQSQWYPELIDKMYEYVSDKDIHLVFTEPWKHICVDMYGSGEWRAMNLDWPTMDVLRIQRPDWITINFNKVQQTDQEWEYIDNVSGADFYAITTFCGREYFEARCPDSDIYQPTNWVALVPILSGDNRNDLQIDIWDEDTWGYTDEFSTIDDHCDIRAECNYRTWNTDNLLSIFFYTNGYRELSDCVDEDGDEHHGDGDEAEVDFTVNITPSGVTVRQVLPVLPEAYLYSPPQEPRVADEGMWTKRSDRIRIWCSSNVQVAAPPVTSYRYRICEYPAMPPGHLPARADCSNDHWYTYQLPAQSTPPREQQIDIAGDPLQHNKTFIIEAIAHNAAGDSPVGYSDGITTDCEPPILSRLRVIQTTNDNFPNSLSAEWEGEDRPSGIRSYSYKIKSQTASTEQWEMIKEGRTSDNRIELRDLSLRNSARCMFELSAFDNAGNENQNSLNAECTITYTDLTPPTPPVPTARFTIWMISVPPAGYRHIEIEWDNAQDGESGIVEYQVAVGSRDRDTDLLEWTSYGKDLRTTLSVLEREKYYIQVKAVNGVGLYSIGRVSIP